MDNIKPIPRNMSYQPLTNEKEHASEYDQPKPQQHVYSIPQNQGDGDYPPPYYPQPHGYPQPATQPAVGYGPAPIVQQPGICPAGPYGPPLLNEWISIPQQIPLNCPPGLGYLTTVDSLFIKQKVELMEVFTGFETNNKYTIKNNLGQKVYYAIEENDCCNRNCCGPSRSFDIKVLDHIKNEVIHIRRELACQSCCFPCCLQVAEVFSPPGHLVGTVEQRWSLCAPKFDIKNESGETLLKLEGPICQCGLCQDVEFEVLSNDKSAVVGKISKKWGGLAREWFTDADNFGISFPIDLDVRMKAVMLGTAFLIDFMFFEKGKKADVEAIDSGCKMLVCCLECLAATSK